MRKNKRCVVPVIIDEETFERIKAKELSCVLVKIDDYKRTQKIKSKESFRKGLELRIINIENGDSIFRKVSMTQIVERTTQDSNLRDYYILHWRG